MNSLLCSGWHMRRRIDCKRRFLKMLARSFCRISFLVVIGAVRWPLFDGTSRPFGLVARGCVFVWAADFWLRSSAMPLFSWPSNTNWRSPRATLLKYGSNTTSCTAFVGTVNVAGCAWFIWSTDVFNFCRETKKSYYGIELHLLSTHFQNRLQFVLYLFSSVPWTRLRSVPAQYRGSFHWHHHQNT